MRRRRTLLVLAAGTLLLLPLTGCGSQIHSYCGALKDHRAKLSAMIEGDSPTALLDQLPMLKQLAGRAPDDLTDDWQTFINAVEGLSDALHQAGIKPSDYRHGKPPAGLTAAEKDAITQAADRLASSTVVDAVQGIDQEAKDVCHLDLGV